MFFSLRQSRFKKLFKSLKLINISSLTASTLTSTSTQHENNNYYEHQLSAMHPYGIPGGEMQQQQPQTPVQQNHGGSSPSSGGQRMSPVTSSVGQSAHGESISK